MQYSLLGHRFDLISLALLILGCASFSTNLEGSLQLMGGAGASIFSTAIAFMFAAVIAIVQIAICFLIRSASVNVRVWPFLLLYCFFAAAGTFFTFNFFYLRFAGPARKDQLRAEASRLEEKTRESLAFCLRQRYNLEQLTKERDDLQSRMDIERDHRFRKGEGIRYQELYEQWTVAESRVKAAEKSITDETQRVIGGTLGTSPAPSLATTDANRLMGVEKMHAAAGLLGCATDEKALSSLKNEFELQDDPALSLAALARSVRLTSGASTARVSSTLLPFSLAYFFEFSALFTVLSLRHLRIAAVEKSSGPRFDL